MEKYKILIDTDPGDDIDDALALAYVLNKDCFEVVGITTTFKDTKKRARIVKKICLLKGVDIPVYYGYGMPVSGYIPESQEINQYTTDLDDDKYSPNNTTGEEDAVDFIIDCCQKYGKNLIIVGIGPLCNLSRAILKNPSALQKVNKTVIMGGCFNSDYPEWNIFCDAKGAKVVFEKAKNLVAVGVEITSRTKLTEEQSQIIENSTKNEFFVYVGELVKAWRKTHDNDRPTLHDILSICTINLLGVCKMENGVFSVDTQNKIGSLIKGQGESVSYAVDFDKERFINEFMSVWL